MGTRAELQTALEYLSSPAVQALGLQINLSKCEIWWPSGDASFANFPPEIKRMPPDGIEILKVPIGKESFIVASLNKRIQKANGVLSTLLDLEDATLSSLY